MNITKDGGVVKTILREGKSEGRIEELVPLPGQKVVIKYEC